MSKHVRHIWAKANQHIRIHRARPSSKNNNDDHAIIYIVIGIVVFIWLIK